MTFYIQEFSIHSGVDHGLLERWALEQTRQGSLELYELLRRNREAEGGTLEELPELVVEELHDCLVCDGDNKEGKVSL